MSYVHWRDRWVEEGSRASAEHTPIDRSADVARVRIHLVNRTHPNDFFLHHCLTMVIELICAFQIPSIDSDSFVSCLFVYSEHRWGSTRMTKRNGDRYETIWSSQNEVLCLRPLPTFLSFLLVRLFFLLLLLLFSCRLFEDLVNQACKRQRKNRIVRTSWQSTFIRTCSRSYRLDLFLT